MANPRGWFQPRHRDGLVLIGVVLLVVIPLALGWFERSGTPPLDTGAELRAQQREDYLAANPGPPFRNAPAPALPQPLLIFRSGPHDMIRSEMGGLFCSIVSLDPETGFLVYLRDRRGLHDYQLFNMRFCEQLTFMANPNIEQMQAQLAGMEPFVPFSSLARPIAENQFDGPFEFSDIQLVNENGAWLVRANVTAMSSVPPQESFNAWFHCEVVVGDRIARGEAGVKGLRVGRQLPLEATLRGAPADLAPSDSDEMPRVKWAVKLTAYPDFGR